MSHVHAFPMHMYSIFNILTIFEMCWDFSDCLSLSLSLFSVYVSSLWHLNVSRLRPGTLFIPGHRLRLILLPLLFGSVMRMLERTSRRPFLNEVFIQNAESF